VKNNKFGKVAIIGMGFMGGSLGHDLLKLKTCTHVTGLGRNLARLKKAKKARACTATSVNFEDGVKDADLVVISLPVLMIPAVFARIRPHLKKGAVVTDMGSTKSDIVSKIGEIDADRSFVGSHPMVGSEKTGIANLKPGLYKGGTCVVTPSGRTDKAAARVQAFWRALGMKVIVMKPGEHDRAVALISHFPHLMSFAGVSMAGEIINKAPEVIGPGFKDATRIAASNEDIWAEIFLSNKKEVLRCIDLAIEELENLSQAVYTNRVKELKDYIRKARLLREKVR
jgi:cyclohexadieny/prephenate dehydrogenase